jgi:hypothetical protein
MPKKEKDVDPQIEKIFTTADHHISDPDDPINVGRASNEASKTNPEGEHMEIDDYSFSVGMELKRETRAGMNIKVGRNEVFRPAETVKIWSNVNFDKRKITFEEAFRGLAEKLLNEMEKLPFADVDSVIEEAKEISASTSPPPPVHQHRLHRNQYNGNDQHHEEVQQAGGIHNERVAEKVGRHGFHGKTDLSWTSASGFHEAHSRNLRHVQDSITVANVTWMNRKPKTSLTEKSMAHGTVSLAVNFRDGIGIDVSDGGNRSILLECETMLREATGVSRASTEDQPLE